MKPKEIDLRGLKCPEPIKRTQEELESIREGVLIVLVESPSNWNIERLAGKAGLKVEGIKHKGYWELKIVKTPHSRPRREGMVGRFLKSFGGDASEGGMALVVTRDAIGGDEALGKTLMKGFFDTMKAMDEIPAFIFFMNTGVMLSASTDDELIGILSELQSKGAAIYSCTTCLKHFGLEDKLRVGEPGGMATLLEGAKSAKRVMTI